MPLFTDHYIPPRPLSMREILQNLELTRKKAFGVAIAKKGIQHPNYIQLLSTCTCRLFHIFYIHPLRYMYI